MQKLLLGFVFLFTIAGFSTLTSCKKDSDGGTNQEKIVGKWALEAMYFESHISGTVVKDTAESQPGSYVQFNSDGTLTTVTEGDTSSGSWSITGNKLNIIQSVDDEAQPAYDIVKLTKNELQLYAKQTEGDDFMEMTLHLKK